MQLNYTCNYKKQIFRKDRGQRFLLDAEITLPLLFRKCGFDDGKESRQLSK